MAKSSRSSEYERVEHFTADPSTVEWASSGKFWTSWQSAVAIMGIPLIAWMYLAPSDLQLGPGWYLVSWLAIFVVATAAGRIRRRF
ncbi:hypothetical protein LSI54_03885 [Nesterenkonia sp. AY15]|uniref:hypothetical protein n=1 Tax=Nesterenkonia sp. AY15 TaxID=2901139 RepID=UPI001F4D0381|nr:hypothetical protein [Nesterenkonia sp. AY15]MCH8570504.1 hypothetical protein [Nesterenkonia sp. AY15]